MGMIGHIGAGNARSSRRLGRCRCRSDEEKLMIGTRCGSTRELVSSHARRFCHARTLRVSTTSMILPHGTPVPDVIRGVVHRLAQIMGHDLLDTTMISVQGTKQDLQNEVEQIAWT